MLARLHHLLTVGPPVTCVCPDVGPKQGLPRLSIKQLRYKEPPSGAQAKALLKKKGGDDCGRQGRGGRMVQPCINIDKLFSF